MNPAVTSALNDALFIARMEPAASPSQLRALTGALARGDDAAWLEFHRDYGPGLIRYLLGSTRGDYDLAAEALQQTYLRVARYARACDSPPQFAGWLRIVASSALNDCRRRRKSFWKLIDRAELAPDTTVRADERDPLSALDAALAQLDPADRTLLEQKYFAGVAVRTLAESMNVSPKAAESRLTRARAALRRLLCAALAHHE